MNSTTTSAQTKMQTKKNLQTQTTTQRLTTVNLAKECKNRLLQLKAEILNKIKMNGRPPDIEDKSGDFGDQNARAQSEHEWVLFQNRLRRQLLEVESALSRLDAGCFGVCEETELPIEPERLLAIPWTRLSIEGARLRESSVR